MKGAPGRLSFFRSGPSYAAHSRPAASISFSSTLRSAVIFRRRTMWIRYAAVDRTTIRLTPRLSIVVRYCSRSRSNGAASCRACTLGHNDISSKRFISPRFSGRRYLTPRLQKMSVWPMLIAIGLRYVTEITCELHRSLALEGDCVSAYDCSPLRVHGVFVVEFGKRCFAAAGE